MRIRRPEHRLEFPHLLLEETSLEPPILNQANLAEPCRFVECRSLTVKKAPHKASGRVNKMAKYKKRSCSIYRINNFSCVVNSSIICKNCRKILVRLKSP